MSKNLKQKPNTLRIVEIILGIIIVSVSMLILSEPETSTVAIAVLFAAALVMIGASSTTYGIISSQYTIRDRVIDVIFGIVAVTGGVIAFSSLSFAVGLLVGVTAIILIIFGIRHIIISTIIPNRKNYFKVIYCILGVLSISLGVSAIFFPNFGTLFTVTLIAIALLINGFLSIFSGIVGDKRYLRIY